MNTLTDMQAELTARWDKACSYMDSGEPYTERFWTSMANFWAMMERFDAVENSLRRAGLEGCINAPETCGEAMAVSCHACVPPKTARALSGDSEQQNDEGVS